jgi:hypothetical protein
MTDKKLGKRPAFARPTSLHLAHFIKADAPPPPPVFNFWEHRAPFPLETFGNTEHGCCTIAKQGVAAMRHNRLEDRQTPTFTTDEILRVYYALTTRLYGGGDVGAYEEDALNNWRRADLTFRDTRGRPHTIDAYARVNPRDLTEVKRAISLSESKGAALCLALPWAWARVDPPRAWDVPADGRFTDGWEPYSWGGHSLYSAGHYDERGLYVTHTWGIPEQLVTWAAVAAYCDEAHMIVDSVNTWGRRPPVEAALDLPALVDAVNQVSSVKIT